MTKAWVKRAKGKKNSGRDAMQEVFALPGCWVATDGFRCHMFYEDTGQDDRSDEAIEKLSNAVIGVVADARNGEITGTITPHHLMVAAKAAKAFQANKITLDFNGRLDASWSEAELGSGSCYITSGDNWRGKSTKVKYPNGRSNIAEYSKRGQDVTLHLDPKFLIAATNGMKEPIKYTVTIPDGQDHASTIYLESGSHHALIMGMHP